MAASKYTNAQRGGGSGATGRRRAAILEQINSWVQNARWVDEDRALELFAKVNEAPERFISPDPDANHREEGSRIYGELKDEFGLRTESDAIDAFRDYEAQAQARASDPDRIDYWGAADDRAAARAEAPDVRPEHSRHFEPAPVDVDAPAVRHTRPLPSWAYGLPKPIKSCFAIFWVFATFDKEPSTYTTA